MKWYEGSELSLFVSSLLLVIHLLVPCSLLLFPLCPFAFPLAWAQSSLTPTLLATIPVGSEPLGITLDPDGLRVYVANARSKTVSVIDTRTRQVMQTFLLEATERLNNLIVSRDGTKLYVTEVTSGTVRVLKLPEGRELNRIKVGDFPQRMALTPDGYLLCIVNTASDNVTLLDTRRDQVLTHIPVRARPQAIVIPAEGTYAYVTSAQTHALSVIDLSTQKMVRTIDLAAITRLLGIAAAPDTRRLYVADNISNAVVEIDQETGRQSRVLQAGKSGSDTEFSPTSVQLSADGQRLYVIGRSGWLSILDIATGTILGTLQIGRDLRDMTLAADGTLYVTSFATDAVLVVAIK